MYVLNVKWFSAALKKQKDNSDQRFLGLPADIDEKQFEEFKRILCAMESSEIADISVDSILFMFCKVTKFTEYFLGRTKSLDGVPELLVKEPGIIPKRRVL